MVTAADSMRLQRLLSRTALAAACLVLVVVSSSAYLRLSQSGLGCEDWPRCYGRSDMQDLPGQPAPQTRALVRVAHRVAAMIVFVLNLFVAFLCWKSQPKATGLRLAAIALVALTIFLAVLGRLTRVVVLPAVTMGNLLGGLAMLALLWWVWLGSGPLRERREARPPLAAWARVGLALLALQIVLGALVTAHYAALGCAGFPSCGGAWWPGEIVWSEVNPFRAAPRSANGEIVISASAAPLQMLHRFGAAAVAAAAGALGASLLLMTRRSRLLGLSLLATVSAQAALGIAAVSTELPLITTWAHNGMTAILLVVLLSVLHRLTKA